MTPQFTVKHDISKRYELASLFNDMTFRAFRSMLMLLFIICLFLLQMFFFCVGWGRCGWLITLAQGLGSSWLMIKILLSRITTTFGRRMEIKTLSDTKIDQILHYQRANAQNEVVLAEEQTNQRCFDGESATSVKKLNLLVFVSVIAAWKTVSSW